MLRLAMLDRSKVIRPVHMLAAAAVWDFCERSTRVLFAGRTGNPVADEIRDLLRGCPNGMIRTELMTALGKHVFGDKLTRALLDLERDGLARREKKETGGQPSERWFAKTAVNTASPCTPPPAGCSPSGATNTVKAVKARVTTRRMTAAKAVKAAKG